MIKSATKTNHDLKIKDIVSCSWGYEQTNVDFYEVVSVTKASVRLRAIAQENQSNDGNWTGTTTPKPGVYTSEPFLVRVREDYRINEELGRPDKSLVKISSYSYARRWDGKPQSYTSYA